ncbi:MAG: hypothetical protein KDD51_05265 [Bdellovibrionales bacterium]|nr:hypothetical protein [Bdellovibrionales bacterium]
MLTKIRPAAFAAVFVLLAFFPASLHADDLTAFDWLNIALNGEKLPDGNTDTVLSLLKGDNALTKARPDLVEKLKAYTTDEDVAATGQEVWEAVKLGLEALIAKEDTKKAHYQEILTDTGKGKITLEDILAGLKAQIREEAPLSSWDLWETHPEHPDANRAVTLRSFLAAQFKEGEPRGGFQEPSDHGGNGPVPGRLPGPLSPFAQKLWDAMTESERNNFPGGKAEFGKLADALHGDVWDSKDGNVGRVEAARKLASHLPQSIKNWSELEPGAFSTTLGFDKTDEKFGFLNGFANAKTKDDQNLYSDILDESRTNVERRIAKEEFDWRKNKYKQKFEDFKNMRSDLVQYYGGKTDSLHDWKNVPEADRVKKMQEAASGFATLLGTVSDLAPFKARKSKEGEYDQQLGTAAELAEKIRKGEITIPEGKTGWEDVVFKNGADKPTGETPKDAFKKQFILDYLKVHGDNLKFEACVDAVNAGKSDERFAECKQWLNDNYSGANLQDYINTKLAGNDGDKVQAARTVVATGLKKDGKAYVMDVDVVDTNAVHLTDPTTGKPLATGAPETKSARGIRLVVGQDGDKPEAIVAQVLGALDHFADDAAPEGDKFSPEAFRGTNWGTNPRGRLASVGLVAGNQPVERAKVSQVYYADEDGKLKNWSAAGLNYNAPPKTNKPSVEVPAAKKPVWLPIDPKEVAQTLPTEPKGSDPQTTVPTAASLFGADTKLTAFDTLSESDRVKFASAITDAGACIVCHKEEDSGPQGAAGLLTKLKGKTQQQMYDTLESMAGYAEENPTLKAQIESYMAAFK